MEFREWDFTVVSWGMVRQETSIHTVTEAIQSQRLSGPGLLYIPRRSRKLKV
jgi:hypothetical protein